MGRKAIILAGGIPEGMSAAKAAWYRRFWTVPEAERPRWGIDVTVPMPPPVDIKPASDKAIVTVATGDQAQAMLAISEPLMRAYALRVGADFHVSTWPGADGWPMSAKYGAIAFLAHYERIAYVDADVLLRPTAIDLFEACPADAIGLVDELPWHRKNPKHGIEADYLKLRARMGFAELPVKFYANAGVVVCPVKYRHLIEQPAEPIPASHLTEQHLLTCRVAAGVADGSVKLHALPREANWQHWTDHSFRAAPPDAVLHFSGMKDREARLKLMRQWVSGISGLVGTELKALLESIGFTDWSGCDCKAKAARMDHWGPDGCREHRAQILLWLRAAAASTDFFAKVMAAPKVAVLIPTSHWTDPLAWLVDESIRRAELPRC